MENLKLIQFLILATLSGCGNKIDCGSSDSITSVAKAASENGTQIKNELSAQLKAQSPPLQDPTLNALWQKVREEQRALKDAEIQCGFNNPVVMSDAQRELGQIVSGYNKDPSRFSAEAIDAEMICVPHSGALGADFYKETDPTRHQQIITPAANRLSQRISDLSVYAIKFHDRYVEAEKKMLSEIKYDLSDIVTEARNDDTGRVDCRATVRATATGAGAVSRAITYSVEMTSKGDLIASVSGL